MFTISEQLIYTTNIFKPCIKLVQNDPYCITFVFITAEKVTLKYNFTIIPSFPLLIFSVNRRSTDQQLASQYSTGVKRKRGTRKAVSWSMTVYIKKNIQSMQFDRLNRTRAL